MAAPMACLEPVEGEGSTGRRASGVELSLPSDPAAPAPMCPHGGSVFVLSLAGWRQRHFRTGLWKRKGFSLSLFLTLCDA